ncbi:MAG: PEP-CTERM sorting domain-containing protein [Sphingobium sp.]|nr:PEP-CTERM sorting domain-containing protein [Sphingobium sp.]
MSSAATTADWVRAERRKQNAVILAVIVACLLVAFFPRNERRLFTFPGQASFIETITAPFQTRLRDDGLSGLKRKPKDRSEMVLPLSQPPLDNFIVLPDPWLGQILPSSPTEFDYKLPNPDLPPVEVKQPDHLLAYNFRPNHFGPPPVFLSGVPEPGTWLMLIAGIGFLTWGMRMERRNLRRRRWQKRWRQHLVPAPARSRAPG